MAVSVHELFAELDLAYEGPVKWSEAIDAKYNGVYVIALTADPFSTLGTEKELNLCIDTFNFWIEEAPFLEIEGSKVKAIEEVKRHLEGFWQPEEHILYIGQSSSKTNPLQKRIKQFYDHKVGQKGPHTGGYWLKLLESVKDCHVFYSRCEHPIESEFKLLMKFVEKSTGKSFYDLKNFPQYFPFANLKIDILKSHGIRHYTNKNTKKSRAGK